MELNWIKKTKIRVATKGYADVTINVSHDNGKNKDVTCITFRNNSHLKITKNEHIVIAIDGTRLYFKQDNPEDGYKLSCFSKERSTCHVKIDSKFVPVTKGVETGSYYLQWDKYLGCHFIDVRNKVR